MSTWKEDEMRRESWRISKTFSKIMNSGQEIELRTSPDQLTVTLTVRGVDGKAMSIDLDYEGWKSLMAMDYRVDIKKPEEKVVEIMTKGQEVEEAEA